MTEILCIYSIVHAEIRTLIYGTVMTYVYKDSVIRHFSLNLEEECITLGHALLNSSINGWVTFLQATVNAVAIIVSGRRWIAMFSIPVT